VRNLESYLLCYLVSCRASHLERNLASYQIARTAALQVAPQIARTIALDAVWRATRRAIGQAICSAIRRAIQQIPRPAVWAVPRRALYRVSTTLRIRPASPVPRPSPLTKYTPGASARTSFAPGRRSITFLPVASIRLAA